MTDEPPKPRIMRNPPAPFLTGSSPVPHVPIAWRDVLSADPTEHSLLATIRATPADEGARLVYADWLEQHDRAEAASFVRHAGKMSAADPRAEIGDPAWRRLVSRAPIAQCDRTECPGRWDLLTADPDDEMTRMCKRCAFVRYVATPAEAATAGGEAGCPIAVDPPTDDLEQRYKIAVARARLQAARR